MIDDPTLGFNPDPDQQLVEKVANHRVKLQTLAGLYIELHKDSKWAAGALESGSFRDDVHGDLVEQLWDYFVKDGEINPAAIQNAIERIKAFQAGGSNWDDTEQGEGKNALENYPNTWGIANHLNDTPVLQSHPLRQQHLPWNHPEKVGGPNYIDPNPPSNTDDGGTKKDDGGTKKDDGGTKKDDGGTEKPVEIPPPPGVEGPSFEGFGHETTPVGQQTAAEALARGMGTPAQRAAMQGAMRAGGIHAGNPFERFATQKLQGALALWLMANSAAEERKEEWGAGTLPDALSQSLQGRNIPYADPNVVGDRGGSYQEFAELNPYIAYSAAMAGGAGARGASGNYMDYVMGQYQSRMNDYLGALATGEVTDTEGADFIRYVTGGPPVGESPAVG